MEERESNSFILSRTPHEAHGLVMTNSLKRESGNEQCRDINRLMVLDALETHTQDYLVQSKHM
jgi:hypothetical protein